MQYCQRQQRQLYLCGFRATHLLVDVGISGKKAEAGLNSLGLTGRDLDGILVTHEHMDHVAGLGVMAENTMCHLCYSGTWKRFRRWESWEDRSGTVS